MVSLTVHLPLSIAVLFAAAGSIWVYHDATSRNMDTADMWAVGLFVAFFLLPILGGLAVLFYYLQKRKPRYPRPDVAPGQ